MSSNLLYLVGFTDEPGERALLLFIEAGGKAVMLVPELYVKQVEQEHAPVSVVPWGDGEDPIPLIHDIAKDLSSRPGGVLMDDDLCARFVLPLQEAFVGRSFGLSSEVMSRLRVRKESEEIAAMKRAGSIADAAYAAVTGDRISGLTELEVAGRLEAAMLAGGADGIAFQTLVASGPNAAHPHHRAGTRRIEAGDIVILDYGCRVDGYCSDISRTIVCGRPSREAGEVHDAVRKAQRAGRERVAIGIEAQEVDAAARDVLVAAGYGAQFVHRTGHGIGLDVHEPPYIVQGNEERLEEGMAFSIEPGAYLDGKFGVRIEDVVVVGKTGAITMTEAPRELKRVE